MSEMPWKKSGTLGSVTVMEEASPEPEAPGPAAPIKEPKSCTTFASGLPSAGWPMEVVLVVWVDVSPEVLMETTGGDVVVDSEEDEVEKDDGELVKEDKVTGSP